MSPMCPEYCVTYLSGRTEQALQRLSLWRFFSFALPHAVSFYRLTIRCVGCSTFLIPGAFASLAGRSFATLRGQPSSAQLRRNP